MLGTANVTTEITGKGDFWKRTGFENSVRAR